MEIEIDRFGITRASTLKKYSMMTPPEGKVADKVNLAVDTIATLSLGLKDGEPVNDADVNLLSAILAGAFPEADSSLITLCISGRPQRTGLYANQ